MFTPQKKPSFLSYFLLPNFIMLDPKLDPRIIVAHKNAIIRGDPGYVDPITGYWVMTADSLKTRGYCCGAGCRHCPWPPDVQRKAGRTNS